MEAHYRTIADGVDLPQIVYNVPSRTGRNIDVETAVSLAEHDEHLGYKAASGDLGQISEIIERTRDEAFAVLSGDDALTLPMLSIGGGGNHQRRPRTSNPSGRANGSKRRFPATTPERTELHLELGPLFRALFAETNPIPVKEAMELRGLRAGGLRLPLSRTLRRAPRGTRGGTRRTRREAGVTRVARRRRHGADGPRRHRGGGRTRRRRHRRRASAATRRKKSTAFRSNRWTNSKPSSARVRTATFSWTSSTPDSSRGVRRRVCGRRRRLRRRHDRIRRTRTRPHSATRARRFPSS